MPQPQPLEDIRISVWLQTMVEQARAVAIGGSTYPVKHTNCRVTCIANSLRKSLRLQTSEQTIDRKDPENQSTAAFRYRSY